MAVQVKRKRKKKARRVARREYRTVGALSMEFEANVMARSEHEAESIVCQVLHNLKVPKAVRVQIGKRSRLVRDFHGYFIETGGTDFDRLHTERADEDNRIIT